mmetsp:Transcript_32433/g.60541  ORF Transcript_32433/g.60541 Transcript_32433/m.60541 type:complete len:247 (+) Transcript_32433:1773-2513(+)
MLRFTLFLFLFVNALLGGFTPVLPVQKQVVDLLVQSGHNVVVVVVNVYAAFIGHRRVGFVELPLHCCQAPHRALFIVCVIFNLTAMSDCSRENHESKMRKTFEALVSVLSLGEIILDGFQGPPDCQDAALHFAAALVADFNLTMSIVSLDIILRRGNKSLPQLLPENIGLNTHDCCPRRPVSKQVLTRRLALARTLLLLHAPLALAIYVAIAIVVTITVTLVAVLIAVVAAAARLMFIVLHVHLPR